jgi:hypothetical protein
MTKLKSYFHGYQATNIYLPLGREMSIYCKYSVHVVFVILCMSYCSYAQTSEFQKFDDGLIYDNGTIIKLKKTVDSLNLKFKSCELKTNYVSLFQTKANYIDLEGDEAVEAKKDVENNISYENFMQKYPKAKVIKEMLTTEQRYIDYFKRPKITYQSESFDSEGYQIYFTIDDTAKTHKSPLKNTWLFEFYRKSEYSKSRLRGYYFLEDFTQKMIPEPYSKLIQYSDCLIDTTLIYFPNARSHDKKLEIDDFQYPLTEKFINYIELSINTDKPQYKPIEFKRETYELFAKKSEFWDAHRLMRVDSLRNSDSLRFDSLLDSAFYEYKKKSGLMFFSNREFEEYYAFFRSPIEALVLKRNRIASGTCSADSRPRKHALGIAKLAAETANWDIFLRSHLDIMNDRFDRVSDGSYAQKERGTYIKELELLDINIPELLIGISLRISNPRKNHYYGSISRLGRAFSESFERKQIMDSLLMMIKDDKLDDYNRVLMYFLYVNTNYFIDDNEIKKINEDKLQNTVESLPDYIKSKIKTKK